MKNLLLILSFLFSFTTMNLFSQCEVYNYQLTTSGFACDLSPGEICVSASADGVDPIDQCADYFVEIEYSKGDFIFTDLGDFIVFFEDDNIIKLRAHIDLAYDIVNSVCLEGLLQEPGTEFILRLIHPETGHIVNGETFYLDDEVEVGTDGVDTYLSQAINDGILLPPNEASNQPQKVIIHGNLLIDEQYYEFSKGSELSMADFDIYPNPASDNITVVLQDRQEAKFEIVNSVGEVIDVVEVNGSANVNTKGYAAGIYFLRDKSGKLATKKFSILK